VAPGHLGENTLLKIDSYCYKFKCAGTFDYDLILTMPYTVYTEKRCSIVERWGNFLHSVLYLQNWFVYDKLAKNLAGEKHLIEFQNNFLPLAENYNSYCQVRFLCASLLYLISEILIYVIATFHKLILVFHESVLLLIMNFVCRLI